MVQSTKILSPRRIVLGLALTVLLVLAAAALIVWSRVPSLDREWDEDVRLLSSVETFADGSILFGEVRNWRYTQNEVVTKDYVAGRYDPADLQGLWLYEQGLGLGGRIAHTFLVFEFPKQYGAGRWLGLSVETRRELGEEYSLLGGLLRKFEVTHLWATEEDLVTRRVEFLDYPLVRYRVDIPGEYLGPIFRQFAEVTAELTDTPRWYNTLTTNCTNSLVAYVNAVEPGAIPWHPSFILTGTIDDYLAELGYLDLESTQRVTRGWLAENPLRRPVERIPPGSRMK